MLLTLQHPAIHMYHYALHVERLCWHFATMWARLHCAGATICEAAERCAAASTEAAGIGILRLAVRGLLLRPAAVCGAAPGAAPARHDVQRMA